jgi:hypothetical protein
MRVGRPFVRDDTHKDDLGGFLDRKFGALDKIGEIGLKESKRRICLTIAFGRWPTFGERVTQRGKQGLKQAETVRIERLTSMARLANRTGKVTVAGAEQATDQLMKFGGFGLISQLRRNCSGIVAQPIGSGLALLADKRIETLFKFVAR